MLQHRMDAAIAKSTALLRTGGYFSCQSLAEGTAAPFWRARNRATLAEHLTAFRSDSHCRQRRDMRDSTALNLSRHQLRHDRVLVISSPGSLH